MEYGPNEPAPVRRLSAVVQLLHLFANPLVIILLVASAISASLGQRVDALDHRDDGAARRLDQLLAVVSFAAGGRATARVGDARPRRCSATARWLETPLRNVVPGDVFRLSAGDLVPADARLLESRDLSVQQSMLTGESLPADKTRRPRADHAERDRPGRARISCSSARRSSAAPARRVAIATGPKTLFGDIAVRLRTPRAGNRVRARPAAVQPADPADDGRAGAVHRACRHRAQARPVRVAAVRRGAGRRAHARVPADDQRRSRSRRARCGWRATR